MSRIATPRIFRSSKPYDGGELTRPPARRGASDAMAIPSRMGDRRLTREQMRAQVLGQDVPQDDRAAEGIEE